MAVAEIIGLILTSSLLSAGLTSWISWLTNKANYKREYYKKLLDRRLDAYEEVESIINSLSTFIRTDHGALCPFVCAGGEKRQTDFLFLVLKAGSKSLWLSDHIGGLITELNVFMLNEIDNHISDADNYDRQLEKLGTEKAATFRRLREQLQEALYFDLRNLSDIPSFMKEIRIPGDFPVQPKP